jgi:hypothetical protein
MLLIKGKDKVMNISVCLKRRLTLEQAMDVLRLQEEAKKLTRKQRRRFAKKKGLSKDYFNYRNEKRYYYCSLCKCYHLTKSKLRKGRSR